MAGSEDSAEHLLERVALGDEHAFETLCARFAGALFVLCHSVLGDVEHAEDTVQDVLLEVWQTAPRFDRARGSARRWVGTMAYRRSVDQARSARAARLRDVKVGVSEVDRDYDDVVERVVLHLDVDRLNRCLAGLPVRQQEVVRLAYYEGRSQSQVADRLELPLGTVKTRIREAVARLRDCLEP